MNSAYFLLKKQSKKIKLNSMSEWSYKFCSKSNSASDLTVAL